MAEEAIERESMDYDVVIVGAGPAGLSAAYQLKKLDAELSVCIVEKGSEVGAHIMSGAVLETRALDELIPEWRDLDAPITTEVSSDELWYFTGKNKGSRIPNILAPKTMHNKGNFIVSLGNVCRWLAEQAEGLGVEIFPGFSASEVIYSEDNQVLGIITGDMGVSSDGTPKDTYMQGMELRGKFTLFAEGARGHIGKTLIHHFELDKDKDPQHFGLGIKEIWKVPSEQHQLGLVLHSAGWPLSENEALGGGFLYHLEGNQIAVGLVTDLSYSNPNLSPYDEFQRYKHHPEIAKFLKGGERLSYGARVIAKGGLQSQARLSFPGGMLIGDDAGTLNFAKIKGSHTAMKSGMVAAESIIKFFKNDTSDSFGPVDLTHYQEAFDHSWAHEELYQQRNFGPAQHRWGNFWGSAYAFIDINLFNGALPWTLHDKTADHEGLQSLEHAKAIDYPSPDGKLSFDKLSSVYLSNTNHEENQPCHLVLADADLPISENLPKYGEPAQRYCPAGVYEVIQSEQGEPSFQINAQNCVHCKTCDIKDPAQNIRWVCPEGAGGPNYPNM